MRKLSAVIRRLSKTIVVVTRTAPGSFVKGRRVGGVQTTFEIRCSIQPLTDKELLLLPEGQRTQAKFKLYNASTATLKVVDDPDHISYLGVEYEVQGTSDWGDTADYERYLLVKVEQVPAP